MSSSATSPDSAAPARPARSRPPARPELLAPAGGPEAAYAALRYGADAVYCGLRRFSARAEAVNFDTDELRSLVAYAHGLPRPRRVFVALNTVTLQSELAASAEAIATVAEAGADALIVQDAGVARLARNIAPALELHASTQMAVHSLEGARAAVAQGFAQVTLARELTLEEIRAIAEAGIRTECFIHGALCYSYSGLCLMASHRQGRSGNRGRCSYPCRERYRLEDTDAEGLAFSMKDLALGRDSLALADAGVACLKIEGRMKNALYVAAVTDFYRSLLDGKLTREADLRAAEQDLQTIFSRPWTRLYLEGQTHRDVVDPEVTGHRGAPIGTVQTVSRDAEGDRWLVFRSERALELHDGLQVDLPGQDRPYGFAIDRFGAAHPGRPVFATPPGVVVDVLLPAEAPRIPPGVTVYCASSQAVKQRYDTELPPAAERKARQPVDVTVHLTSDSIRAEVRTSEGLAASDAASGIYAPAKDAGRMAETLRDAFSKMGGTDFALRTLEIDNPEGLFAPVSHLNALRRGLTDRLAELCAEAFTRRIEEARACALELPHVPPAPTAERWIVHTDQPDCLAQIKDADEVVLELASISDAQIAAAADAYGLGRVRLALPVIARAWETDRLRQRIEGLLGQGYRLWMISNPAGWELLPDGLDMTVDWTLPSFNAQAIASWLELGATGVTLSTEDTRANLGNLLPEWGGTATVVLYQDTPLMISEACPITALTGECRDCQGNGQSPDGAPRMLEPVRGGEAVLTQVRGCRTTLFHERPYALTEQLSELRSLGARSFRVDFALRPYSAEEAAKIWAAAKSGERIRASHSGNWSRTAF